MSFPDARGPRIPKRHPACPGKRRCRLPSCIHNAPISTVSASETSVVDLYEADGNATHGANYPTETCVRGGESYQRLDAGSELGSNDRRSMVRRTEQSAQRCCSCKRKFGRFRGV